MAATVAKAAYLGDHMEYTMTTPVGELFLIDRAVTAPLAPGAAVELTLADHGITVVPG
jgi:iron(III) transport system ATP-binding protein